MHAGLMPANVRTLSISRSTSALAIASIGPIALFLIALVLTAQARGVPDNDYWSIFTSMVQSLDGLPSLSELYVRGNEHIIAGAKLLFVLNFHLTGGDNIGLSVIAVAFSLFIALILSCAFALFARTRLEAFAVGIAVTLFVFSPLAAHNFFLGMSGVMWIGANLFTVLAAWAFWRSAEKDRPMGYLAAIVLAAIASQFYSTGLTALCAIGIQGFFADKTRRLGILLFAVGLAYVILIAVFQKVPEYHAARNFNPTDIVLFCLTFIGGGIVTTESNAIPLGAIGLGAAVLIAGFSLFRPGESRFRSAFWIAIMAYAVMSSGLAAIGRGNMGGDMAALSSRYATLPALFWVGLFGAGSCLPWRIDFSRLLSIVIFAVVAALLVMNGTPRLMEALARAEGKDFTTLALSLGIKDPDLMQYVTSTGFQYYAVENDLKKFNHVPFNGRDFGCPALGAQVAVSGTQASLTGYIDIVSKTQDPRWVRVSGWVAGASDERPPLLNSDLLSTYRCIAFLDGKGTVVGLGLGGFHRPDVAKVLGRKRDDYGWSGYIDLGRLSGDPSLRSVYVGIVMPTGWEKLERPVEVGLKP